MIVLQQSCLSTVVEGVGCRQGHALMHAVGMSEAHTPLLGAPGHASYASSHMLSQHANMRLKMWHRRKDSEVGPAA